MFDPEPLVLSLKLALTTTILLTIIGVPLAAWLNDNKGWAAALVRPIVGLPLVLPPTVLGFYLLVLLGPSSLVGGWFYQRGISLVFSFWGLVIGSCIFGLPFMVDPILSAMESFPRRLLEAAASVGKGPLRTLWEVVIPNIMPSILAGVVLTFAHTVGEFGVVMMIGGSIPGRTKTASIAVFSELEALNYAAAHGYAVVLLGMAFVVLFCLQYVNSKMKVVT